MKRTRQERVGYARERVWRLTYSEPTDFTLMGAFADI